MQHAALSTRQEINGQDKPGAGVMDGARNSIFMTPLQIASLEYSLLMAAQVAE